jgi:long-chain acyl-CoA synthetase
MSVKRIFDLLPHMLNNFPKEDALAGKENGKWKTVSTVDFINKATQFSYGIAALG